MQAHDYTEKGRFKMIRKAVLLLLMSVPLAGAFVTATPAPVLLMMGGLIVLALTITRRVEQQE
jgi:hypothetical protein